MTNILFAGFLVTLLALGGNAYADGHGHGPTLEPVGELKFDLKSGTGTEGSRITGIFGPGTITFNSGGGGTVDSCVEDGYVKKSGAIDFSIWCHVTLDDAKTLLIKYAGTIVGGEDFYDRFSKGEVMGPGNGMSFWFNELKMLTGSEKYGWLNTEMFVGEGVALSNAINGKPGIVHYKLYKLAHSK